MTAACHRRAGRSQMRADRPRRGPTMLRRILLGFLALVIVAAVSLAVWEPLTGEAPPATTFKPADVCIARDTYGVPHIFGRTDADVAYGARQSTSLTSST